MSNLEKPISFILPRDIIEDYRNQILSSISTCKYAIDFKSFNVMDYVKEYTKFKIEEMVREMGVIVLDLTLEIDFEKYFDVLNMDFMDYLRSQNIIEPDFSFLYNILSTIESERHVKVIVSDSNSQYCLLVTII